MKGAAEAARSAHERAPARSGAAPCQGAGLRDPFARPRGRIGAWAGLVMARENAAAEAAAARLVSGPGLVLELGCGPGVGLQELGPRGVGIDLSRPMVEQAARLAPHAKVVRGDAGLLPFADRTFVAAMAVHSLALLPPHALQEARRVLRHDGRLVALHRRREHGGPEARILRAHVEAAGFHDARLRSEGEWTLLTARA